MRDKNIRPVAGKPLITHTIEQAFRWGKGTHVVVSTDSPAIAEVAKGCGAEVPFSRPAELSGDESPKIPVIRHALRESERIFGKEFSVVVDLDATAPLRHISDIEGCFQKFLTVKPLTLFSVVRAHRNPYFNMVEENGEGLVSLCKSLPGVHRRQDAPQVYDMNASIYVYAREYLLDEGRKGPLSERSAVYVMEDVSGFDIDREIDLKFIDILLREGLYTP